jgi:hypothetical protein
LLIPDSPFENVAAADLKALAVVERWPDLCEHVFVREYGYTVTEHDPERPWIIRNQHHHSVQLPDDELFFDWAYVEWPGERFTVQLDPWQLAP